MAVVRVGVRIDADTRWGNRESGIDGGGLFKEFLTRLVGCTALEMVGR